MGLFEGETSPDLSEASLCNETGSPTFSEGNHEEHFIFPQIMSSYVNVSNLLSDNSAFLGHLFNMIDEILVTGIAQCVMCESGRQPSALV